MTTIFRTTTKAWLTKVIAPALFTISCSILVLALNPYKSTVIALGVIGAPLLFKMKMAKRFVLLMWYIRLEVNRATLKCITPETEIEIRWTEVQAVSKFTRARESILQLTTTHRVLSIPLKLIDGDAFYELVQRHVPATAFQQDAIKNSDAYKAWAVKAEKLVDQVRSPLRVYLTFLKVLGWIFVLFFLSLSVVMVVSGQLKAAPWFLIGVAVGIYVIVMTGQIEVSPESIALITPMGRYQIGWDEVRTIEIDAGAQQMVFCGDNKWLSVSGPAYWSGPDKAIMIDFISARIEQLRIDVRKTLMATFRLSKNTKVRLPTQRELNRR